MYGTTVHILTVDVEEFVGAFEVNQVEQRLSRPLIRAEGK
jgi:hypothetical protein